MDIVQQFDGPWSAAPALSAAALLLFCNDDDYGHIFCNALTAAGLGDCRPRPLRQPWPELPANPLIIVHIGDETDATATEMERFAAYVELHDAVLICSTRLDLLDVLTEHFVSGSTHWLVDARFDEVLLTLMSALGSRDKAARQARLRDRGAEDAQAALARLTDELARMGRWLTALAEREEGDSPEALQQGPISYRPGPDRRSVPDRPLDAPRVRSEIAARRARSRFFDDQMFGEPCWDMLLDLFAARLEDKRVSVSSLCIAAAVPPTTALRWIKYMTDVGLIERIADTADARRVFVQLSDSAAGRMAGWFEAHIS